MSTASVLVAVMGLMFMSKESEIREALWSGVPFKQALRDVISKGQTGYSYEELKKAIAEGEDLLDEDDIEAVGKTVNAIAHMFVYYNRNKDLLVAISEHKTTIRREKKGEPSFMEVVPLDKIREILNG